MHTKMVSIGKRIPLVASIAFHNRRKKELSINEQAVRPPMRQNRQCSLALRRVVFSYIRMGRVDAACCSDARYLISKQGFLPPTHVDHADAW